MDILNKLTELNTVMSWRDMQAAIDIPHSTLHRWASHGGDLRQSHIDAIKKLHAKKRRAIKRRAG